MFLVTESRDVKYTLQLVHLLNGFVGPASDPVAVIDGATVLTTCV